MPEVYQSNRNAALEAVTDLARKFSLRMAITFVLWLAMLELLNWFPELRNGLRFGIAIGVALLGTSAIIFFLDRRPAP